MLDPSSDRIPYANDAACTLLGYDEAELVTTSISAIHPANRPLLEDFLSDVATHRRGWTILLTWKTKAGRFIPTETAALTFDHHHKPYVLVLITDVSHHRRRVAGGQAIRHLDP